MLNLKSDMRNSLSKRAHHLNPVVIIGKAGLTQEVIAAIKKALEDHELIKVKFLEFKEEKREITVRIAEELTADIVRIIGNIAIFYKKNEPAETGVKKEKHRKSGKKKKM